MTNANQKLVRHFGCRPLLTKIDNILLVSIISLATIEWCFEVKVWSSEADLRRDVRVDVRTYA